MTIDPSSFPRLSAISSGLLFLKRAFVYTGPPLRPEMVLVPTDQDGDLRPGVVAFTAQWNAYWEAGPYRPEALQEKVPPDLRALDRFADKHVDVVLVPVDSGSDYGAYAPLYHLLPHRLLVRHELPIVDAGIWPRFGPQAWCQLDSRSTPRLQHAFAEWIWPLLVEGRSALDSHPKTDSLVVLAHNLGFWLPAMELVLRRRGLMFGRVEVEDAERAELDRVRKSLPPDLEVDPPSRGGSLWCGEHEAREVGRELVDAADEIGGLRSVVDAIRAHRVADDFSERWSFEREDFERKLYSKRAKVRVSFVEIDTGPPIIGHETDLQENLLWRDVFAVVDRKDRRVVVCLQKGTTLVGDIARELGYANHSPVSKALARIRRAVMPLLE